MLEHKYSVQDLRDVVYKNKQPPQCDVTMNIAISSADQGNARGTWTVDESFINGHGVAMGGFVTAAADIMMAYAIASQLQGSEGFSSINVQTTFHRPVVVGIVEVQARVERKGKSTAYLEAYLIQNGKKVATATSSMLILKP